MKRWRPKTLKTQIMLILCSVLMFSQTINLLIFVHNRDLAFLFQAVLPDVDSILYDALVAYMLITGVIALSLAWYLIRKTVAPIERLADAADRIGVNFDNPPLDEGGPQEVSLAAKAFNRMQSRLANLLHSQTQMLAAISHDLRSAVTRLQLRAELVPDENLRTGMLQVVTDMQQMTQSVLDFARGQQSNEAMRRVNIAALVESLCEDMLDEGFPVDYQCGDNVINLECRITEVRRGLQNIINNAIKYAGSAHVSLLRETGPAPQQEYAVIIVEDEGPGIPPEQIDYVMQPFHRLEQSRNSQTGGIGLGLSITQNIVQGHGGVLKLKSGPEGGLRVEMHLPL